MEEKQIKRFGFTNWVNKKELTKTLSYHLQNTSLVLKYGPGVEDNK